MEKSFAEWTPADRERVLAQLDRILAGRTFAAAARLQELLKYVVTESVSGRGARLNQASIAIDVLGRDERFDPAVDSVVRVEAGRLRAKLRDYYDEEGRNDPVRIELPKGAYEPRVRFDGAQPTPGRTPDTRPSAPVQPPPPAARSSGMPRRDYLIGLFVTAVVLAGVFLRGHFREHPVDEATPTQTSAAATPAFDGARSLAVLPFLNSSAASEDAGFFADGLHDDLLTQLTKIADLTVISRTSVMGYRDVQKPIPQIAQELGVHAVLEGAVQRAGDRVRVNVQLIDGRTDKHLWAESFDQELNATNIFEIQRRIATEIATQLHATLSPQEQSRLAVLPTQNFEAYEAYLRGRARLARRTLDDIKGSIELFQRAATLDPGFALAHVGVAEAWYVLNNYGGADRGEMLNHARPAIDRAFALNDQIGEAWTVLAALRVQDDDPRGAEEAFRKAIELNPNYALAWHWYSMLVADAGDRGEETIELARRARELDPLSPLLRANLAIALEGEGRLDEAEAEALRGIELDPSFVVTHEVLGFIKLLSRQDAPAALQWFQKAVALAPNTIDSQVGVIESYLMLGDTEAAAPLIERLRRELTDREMLDLWESRYEFAFGDPKIAARIGRELLKSGGKYTRKQRPYLLRSVRDDDLAAGRFDDARELYATHFPELAIDPPQVTRTNLAAAIDLALVYQKLGDGVRAARLLDAASAVIAGMPRTGTRGYQLADVQIAALRGDKAAAIAAMRRAVNEGWRWYWIERPDRDPGFALVRDDPEFQSLLKDIQVKLAAQAAEVRTRQAQGTPAPPAA